QRRRAAEGHESAARPARLRGCRDHAARQVDRRRRGARPRRVPRRLARAPGDRDALSRQVPPAARGALEGSRDARQPRPVPKPAGARAELGTRVNPGGTEFLSLTTTGRRTGQPREIEIWFTERAGLYYVVAEHLRETQWVQNIVADPRVRVRVADADFP